MPRPPQCRFFGLQGGPRPGQKVSGRHSAERHPMMTIAGHVHPAIPDLDPLKAFLSAQPRRVRIFDGQLQLVWSNRNGAQAEEFLPGTGLPLPGEGFERDRWPVHLVLGGASSSTRLYPAPAARDANGAGGSPAAWKVTAWPFPTEAGLLAVEETEETDSPEDGDVALKQLDQDIENLLENIFEYLHKGTARGPLRLSNPHLSRCVEERVCTNENCPAYHNPEVARCWEVTAFNQGHESGDLDILERFQACSECGIFDMASPDSPSRIAENFNRLISLLQLKYQETLDVQYRMQQADKLAVMGQLLGGIAHEIKNPLGIIIGRLDVIGLELDSLNTQELTEDISTIYEQANRIRHIIDHLLDTARPEPPKFTPIHMNSVVIDSLKMVRKTLLDKRLRITLDLQKSLPPIAADQIQMQQVLLNLILNARDAMAEGGRLHIASRVTSGPDEGVEVTVTDDGEGIAPELLRKLFSSYQTTKLNKGGTGLGLAVCRRIMDVHGGRIAAESIRNEGTTMRLWLPLKGCDP